MKSHAIKNTETFAGAFSGLAVGVGAVFVPFLFDAIHSRSSTIAALGCIYFFAVIAAFFSAAVRFFGTLFSPRIRELAAKHPVTHAFWFAVAAGVILGIVILMFYGPAHAA
jgi:protein-S-isoprenylcysteine O-methyltransferase Ste14